MTHGLKLEYNNLKYFKKECNNVGQTKCVIGRNDGERNADNSSLQRYLRSDDKG